MNQIDQMNQIDETDQTNKIAQMNQTDQTDKTDQTDQIDQMNQFLSWDGNCSEDVAIFRSMLWDDPRKVYRCHGPDRLRQVFLVHGHEAPKRTRSFWMRILKIDDEELEVNRRPEKSFRTACKIWDY